MQKNIKVAIAGVGNCASALVQGVEYYRTRNGTAVEGIMRQTIGGYSCSDVEFVAAFDIDRRKVGHALEEAIFAKPNCTRIFQSVPAGVERRRSCRPGSRRRRGAHGRLSRRRRLPVRRSRADRYRRGAARIRRRSAGVLPAGRLGAGDRALRPGLSGCRRRHDQLRSRCSSPPIQTGRRNFGDAGVPIIGDDIKSQVGATIVHRALAGLFADRGVGSTAPISSTPAAIPTSSTCWSATA